MDNSGIQEIKQQLENLTKKFSFNDSASNTKLTSENTDLKLVLSQRENEIRDGRKAKKELEDKLIERHNKYQFKKDQLKTERFAAAELKTSLTEELNSL